VTYVLFVHDRPDALTGLPVDERRAIFAEYEALQALPGLAGRRLKPASHPLTVALQAGQPTVARDPVNRELPLAGFYLLETDDREQAIEIAKRIPAARLGGAVEIQALMTES
jgi:hypothetical protein